MTRIIVVQKRRVYPTVVSTATGNSSNGSVVSSFNAPLPASLVSGNLLILAVGVGRAGASPVISTPSGWTVLYDSAAAGNLPDFKIFYKTSTGSEGSTVALTATATAGWASVAYQISDFQGTPVSGTGVTGSSSAPNPPSASLPDTAKKALWIACVGATNYQTGGNVTPTAPSNFGNILNAVNTNSGDDLALVSCATRTFFAASQNPGTFGGGNFLNWSSQTIGILGR
jgi:hypothetical protein